MKLVAPALAIALSAATASAQPAKLAAIAPDPSNVAAAILIGPGGQVYGPVPDAGGWTRTAAGGIAAGASVATRTGDDIFAANAAAPPYRWHDGGWTAIPLPAKGALVMGGGPAVSAAVGTAVFVRQAGAWTRAATAPSAPTSLWAASPTQIWIVADGAAWHLRGKTFERGPAAVSLARADRPLALAGDQAIELATGRAIHAAAPIVAAATTGADTWLLLGTGAVLRRHGKATDALTPPAHAWAWIWTDSHGRAAVAAPTGEVAIFDGRAWRDAPVDTAPLPGRPGPGPATSR